MARKEAKYTREPKTKTVNIKRQNIILSLGEAVRTRNSDSSIYGLTTRQCRIRLSLATPTVATADETLLLHYLSHTRSVFMDFSSYTWVSQYQTFIVQWKWSKQPSSRTLPAVWLGLLGSQVVGGIHRAEPTHYIYPWGVWVLLRQPLGSHKAAT